MSSMCFSWDEHDRCWGIPAAASVELKLEDCEKATPVLRQSRVKRMRNCVIIWFGWWSRGDRFVQFTAAIHGRTNEICHRVGPTDVWRFAAQGMIRMTGGSNFAAMARISSGIRQHHRHPEQKEGWIYLIGNKEIESNLIGVDVGRSRLGVGVARMREMST